MATRRHLWATGVRAAMALASLAYALPAAAQLRIVDYNIAQNYDIESDPGGLNLILGSIGSEVRGGVAKPIDVITVQEMNESGSDAGLVASMLNSLYGVNSYMAAPVPANGMSGGNGLPGLVYNSASVSLIDTLAFGDVGSTSTQQPRSSLRFELRPVGYDSSADFYLYSDHYKSDDSSTDQARRNVEAASVRANADALGEGAHAIYAGDYNVYRSSEPMYQTLLSPGAGQAFDPINAPGSWSSASFTDLSVHTQSPATSTAFSGQVLGGMNDRFDFQLVTGEMLDGEGMSMIAGSYHAFGNNGTHTRSAAITTGSGAAPNVLTALTQASDHLPVVADYQLPARMGVQAGSFPASVAMGAAVSVDVLVENLANAVAAVGADELDYTLSVAGDLFGGGTGTIAALGAGNTHQVTLNTATAGLKSGTITVLSTSQGAANPLFTLPVSFTVGGGGATRQIIAKDTFDATMNLNDFTQTPPAGTYTVSSSGFQTFQVGVSPSIPFALLDDSANGFPSDSVGVIDSAAKTDAWFGVTDTLDNANPQNNPDGECTATWTFNVAGASALEVSIDMGAMGDFEAAGANRDRYDWTYSIDGGAFQPLFTSSVDESATADYTMAGGAMAMLNDPLFMTTTAGAAVQLTNVMQTLISSIVGTGSTLTIQLVAKTDGMSEAYAFDNLLVTGLVPTFNPADFNNDGFVNAADLVAWRSHFGLASGATQADGDANEDGRVDGADFLVWQQAIGAGSAAALSTSVSEPRAFCLILAVSVASAASWRRWRRFC